MHTIVELPEYKKKIEKLLTEEENRQIISFLAKKPTTGVVIQGTGGVRKLRWGKHDSGKSGGVRVIYYYHNEDMPLFLLTAFGKNEMSNLTKSQQNTLCKLTKLLKNASRG